MTTKDSVHKLENINNNIEKSQTHKTLNVINTIFDESSDAVFGVDSKGNIGYLNKQCNELFGLPKNISLSGRHCSDLLCGGDDICSTQFCTQCAIKQNIDCEKQISDFQINIKNYDGNQMKVSIGTCYFYQTDQQKVSTYFSLKEIY